MGGQIVALKGHFGGSMTNPVVTIDAILEQRGKVYGDFSTHAHITQELKFVSKRYDSKLNVVHLEALDMIYHKIARILNGDPNYRDSWDDIAGYAKLAADRCQTIS
jgi:hypothetical protein